ncbi:MAG TPA: hypothetical protein VG013_39295 [Gemmataceae bacterium]|nr:hypothetical protein [Gemmataceae bacterium]
MPIRFRCAYCNQLMGIARRKAGQVVQCPKCARQVVVPSTDIAAEPEPSAPAPANEPLFERSDFDALFNPQAASAPAPAKAFDFVSPPAPPFVPPAPPPLPVPGPAGTQVEAGFDVERVLPVPSPAAPPASRPGIVLSPTMATVLSVAAIVGLALAFAIGLLVGYLIKQGPSEEEKSGSRAGRVAAYRAQVEDGRSILMGGLS